MNNLVLMKTLRDGCLAGPDGLDLADGPTINGESSGEIGEDAEVMG